MDINKEIQKTSDKVIAEKLPEMVEKATITMLESIISNIFSSYGDMAKEIKNKISESLDINLQKFDTVDYNVLVANAINENITQQVNLEPILRLTKDAIGFINRKEIKLSEIVEMFREESMGDSDDHEGEFSVHIKESSEHNWIEVHLDTEADKQEFQCGIKFIFSTTRGTIFSFHHQDYASTLGEITPARIASLNTLEHKIFRLYAAQVKIIADELDFDNEWFKYD